MPNGRGLVIEILSFGIQSPCHFMHVCLILLNLFWTYLAFNSSFFR
jgi:hypothetical protein